MVRMWLSRSLESCSCIQLAERSNTDLYGTNGIMYMLLVTVSTNVGSGAVSVASVVSSMPAIFELSPWQVLFLMIS